jgi:helicase
MLGSFEFTAPGMRHRARSELLGDPAPLKSLLAEELVAGAEQSPEAEATLSSQFLAAIGENPNSDNLADDFASHMYGAFSDQSHGLKQRLRGVQHRLTDTSQPYVFAAAASPLRYTPLGISANQTGFSPGSCISIIETMKQISSNLNEIELIEFLLLKLSHLPEQQYTKWKEKIQNPRKRLMVAASDLNLVLQAWLAGTDYARIFAMLPAARRSGKGATLAQWQAGDPNARNLADEYDKFLDFCLGVLERYLPWLLQACYHLAGHAGHPSDATKWLSLKERITDRVEKTNQFSGGEVLSGVE